MRVQQHKKKSVRIVAGIAVFMSFLIVIKGAIAVNARERVKSTLSASRRNL